MKTIEFGDKTYEVDDQYFLLDYNQWDEEFAKSMAFKLNIPAGLSDLHWQVINFIRDQFKTKGICPLVYETCKINKLTLKKLNELFPTGYLRGACLIAGVSYRDRWVYGELYPPDRGKTPREKIQLKPQKKVYRVDVLGFLVDPKEWDEDFAINRAYEMNMRRGLSKKHWQIIHYLRNHFIKTDKIPTIYDCCNENQIEIEELETLFPQGYHRGAVKIAGLPSLGR